MPIESIFISYSRDDLARVEALEQQLQEQGIRVWRDLEANRGGDNWPARIGEAIVEHDAVLLCWSASARTSHFVTVEWSIALAQRKLVIPYMLDRAPLHPSLSWLNAIDSPRMLLRTVEDEEVKEQDTDNTVMELLASARDAEPQHIIELLRPLLERITPRRPKKLTDTIPRVRQDKIVGRRSDLEDLHTRLFDNRQVVLVNGLGGIGKTTLAQVYVDTYYDAYHHIAWISQLSEDIMTDVVNTAGFLGRLGIHAEGKDIETLFSEVLQELDRIEEAPCLLVIDNATSALNPYYNRLPGQPGWHVLVTSRQYLKPFDVKELDFLSEDDAVALFLTHYRRKRINEEEIREVVRYVDHHTLTIEILARTAHERNLKADALLQALREDTRTGDEDPFPHKGERIDRVTSYLCSIFSLSALSEDETWLLQQVAFLPPEFHGYALIEDLIQPEAHEKEEVFAETLSKLVKKGWLLENLESEQYKMHRIVGEVVHRTVSLAIEAVSPLITALAARLEIDQAKDNPVDKFIWVPFGKHVLELVSGDGASEIAVLQNNLALVLKALGDYAGAKVLLEKALRSDEENFGASHPNTAVRYSNLATVLQDLGDYAGAKVLLEKALRSDEENFGASHPTTAVSYSNLALVLKDLGDYAGAKVLLEKALRSAEENFGASHPNTAVRYSNLALVLQDLGDYAGAKVLLEKALRSDEENFGASHPNTAVRYSNLALVLQDLGDYAGAKVLLEKALRSDEENFGASHPNTAVSYSNLALVLQDLGDYAGAKVLLEKALRSDEENFGASHPNTAVRYSNLALVLKDLGDYAGAKVLLEKALRSAEENFGASHPKTAVSYSNLALVLQDLGDYAGAKVLLEKALRSDEENFGASHPNTAVRYSNLALVLKDLGDYAGAKVLLEKALRSAEENFGASHPNTAVSYSNLALVLQDLGDYAGAKVLLEKALRSAEENFGASHPNTAVRYSNLALVLQDLGDYAGAKVLLEKALRSAEENFGASHPNTAVSYSNLALVLQDLGDYAGAKVLLEKALRSDEENFGASHPTTAVRYSNLATVLQDLGDYKQALMYSGKSVAIFEKALPPGHPSIATVRSIYNSIKAQL